MDLDLLVSNLTDIAEELGHHMNMRPLDDIVENAKRELEELIEEIGEDL